MFLLFALLLKVLFISLIYAKKGYGPGEQDWGYVDVSEGGHMFYWLFYTVAEVKNYTERPLVLWLEGGPGNSASGISNFQLIGPIDVDDKKREYSWVNYVNLLLIDNPVGAGYSYVDDIKYLSKTNNEIAQNIIKTMKAFYESHPEFLDVPLHIFGESYGGRMGIETALELWKAAKNESTKFGKVKSMNMGNPWISPNDTLKLTPEVAYEFGALDEDQRDSLATSFNLAQDFRNLGFYELATLQIVAGLKKLCDLTAGISPGNVFSPVNRSAANCDFVQEEEPDNKLQIKMNGEVKSALQIPEKVTWNSQQIVLVLALLGDFSKSFEHKVEEVLRDTDINVTVFVGSMDLLCPTVAILSWIRRLQWPEKSKFDNAARRAYYVKEQLEGYEKSGGRLSMIWILRAGHTAVGDNPSTVASILNEKTGVKEQFHLFDLF